MDNKYNQYISKNKRSDEPVNGWQVAGETIGDFLGRVVEGAQRGLEGMYDIGASAVAGIAGLAGNEAYKQELLNRVKYDWTYETFGKRLNEGTKNSAIYTAPEDVQNIVRGVGSGIGQMLPIVVTGGIAGKAGLGAKAVKAIGYGGIGASAAGGGVQEALNEGADLGEALGYGAISGGIEAGTEMLSGGIGKAVLGKGLLDGKVAATGAKRIIKGALGEAGEEVVSELANPLARTIYKGKDALNAYGEADYWKGVAQAGLIGGLTSLAYEGTVNPIMAKAGIGYSGKDADIVDSLEAIGELNERRQTLFDSNKLNGGRNTAIVEKITANYNNIQEVLVNSKPEERAKLIKKYDLGKQFNENGAINEQLTAKITNARNMALASPQNGTISLNLAGKEDKIAQDLFGISNGLQDKVNERYQKSGGQAPKVAPISVYQETMTEGEQQELAVFKSRLSILNALGGREVGFVVTSPNKYYNGSYHNGTIYLSVENLRGQGSDPMWYQTFLHEYTHTLWGTAGYKALARFMLSLKGTKVDNTIKKLAETYGLTADIDALLNKDFKDLTPSEREFVDEFTALMVEDMLGNKQFINKLVRLKPTLANKVLNFFSKLKNVVKKNDPTYAIFKATEDLYLNAVKLAGYKYEGGKLVTNDDDKEDEGRFSLKDDEARLQQEYDTLEKKMNDTNLSATEMMTVDDEMSAVRTKQFKVWNKQNSLGQELSKGQQDYFRYSRARDSKGRLRVMYHGTNSDTFTKFEKQPSKNGQALGEGYYFGTKTLAQDYGNNLIEVYLNIANPFYTDVNKGEYLTYSKATERQLPNAQEIIDKYFPKWNEASIKDIKIEYINRKLETSNGAMNLFEFAVDESNGKYSNLSDILQELGFDGVIGGDEMVVYNSNQIKATDNANPTEDSDIRFSLKIGDELQETPTKIKPNDLEQAQDTYNDVRFSISAADNIAENHIAYAENKGSEIDINKIIKADKMVKAMAEIMNKYKDLLPQDKIGKVIQKNGSYDRSVENTTICLRTLVYNAFVEKVQEEIGRPLTQMESFLVSQKLYDIAKEPQCLYCYVSLDRKAYGEYLTRYFIVRDEVIDRWNNSDKSKKARKEVLDFYLYGLPQVEIDKRIANGIKVKPRKETKSIIDNFNLFLKLADDTSLPRLTLKDVATEERKRDIARLGGDLGLQLKKASAYAQNASHAKKQLEYVAYYDEILKLSPRIVKQLNSHYGMRWYSFSDYSGAFIVENMQQIIDASIRGLKGLAYTKDTDFAKIFAPTGMNINISMFVKERNGKFEIDERQSANLQEAIELRKKYPNVGIVVTATNDAGVRWALDQEWSDVVIPFHIVMTGQDVAEFYKWDIYTQSQADRIIDQEKWDKYLESIGKKKANRDIYPHEHQNDFNVYMKLIEERGLKPRFSEFIEHKNYMKLVNETRQSESATKALQPNFDLDAAKQSFDKFVDKGGYYGGWYNEGVDEQAEVSQVVEDIKAGRKANEVEYGRQDIDFEAMAKSRTKSENRVHNAFRPTSRFSLKDSEGNTLSDEQQDFFADSKVRNDKGELQVVYHGSNEYGFTTFDATQTDDGISLFFTDNSEVANSYMDNPDNKYKLYLNITNPKIIDGHKANWNNIYEGEDKDRVIVQNMYNYLSLGKKYIDEDLTIEDIIRDVGRYYEFAKNFYDDFDDYDGREEVLKASKELDKAYAQWKADNPNDKISDAIRNSFMLTTRDIASMAKEEGYDGVIFKDIVDYGYNYDVTTKKKSANIYVAFDSNQVKLTINKTPTDNDDIRFSLKQTRGQDIKDTARRLHRKTYTLEESREIIDSILMNDSFQVGKYYIDLRGVSKKQAIRMLWEQLNKGDYTENIIDDITNFIIDNAVLDDVAKEEKLDTAKDTISALKDYYKGLNLSNIRDEIKYRYDKDNSVYARWSNPNGTALEDAKAELAEVGIIIDADTPAEILFELDDMYRDAVSKIKVSVDKTISELDPTAIADIRSDIRSEIYNGKREFGSETKVAKLIEDYTDTIRTMKSEGRLIDIAKRLKDLANDKYVNASEVTPEPFKKAVKKLARIEYRGNVNESSSRKYVGEFRDWYSEDNTIFISKAKAEELESKGEEVSDYIVYNEEIHNSLDKIANGKGRLSLEEVRTLERALMYFRHMIESYKAMFKNGKWVDAVPIAKDKIEIIEDNQKIKNVNTDSLIFKALSFVGDPASVIKKMDYYNPNGFFTETFEDIRQGAINSEVNNIELTTELNNFFRDKKNKGFKKSLYKKVIAFRGHKYTLGDLITLYCTSLDKDSHITLGLSGFRHKGINSDNKVNASDGVALANDNEEVIEQKVKDMQDELYSLFNESEREFIEIVGESLAKARTLKYAEDMELNGYSNIKQGYYFPLKRDHKTEKIYSDMENELNEVKENSFNKDRTNSKGKLFIENIASLLPRHLKAVALYRGMGTIENNLNMLYNVNISANPNNPVTIRTTADSVWAKGYGYLKKIITDIHGIGEVQDGSGVVKSLRSNYVKYQLGLNIKVWATQLSSLIASMNILSPVNVIRSLTTSVKGDEVDKYSRVARIRNADPIYMAKAIGVIDDIGAFGDKLMQPISFVDRLVVKKLFVACQHQVEKSMNLKFGTEENKIEAGKLLDRVILDTQQNSLATESSRAMRSQNEIIKATTMFTRDSLKLLAMFYTNYDKARVLSRKIKQETDPTKKEALIKERNEARKSAGRAAGVLASVAVFMAILTQAFRTLYNKDKDKEDELKYLAKMIDEAKTDEEREKYINQRNKILGEFALSIGGDAIGNLFGGIPIIKDFVGFFQNGYDIDNYANATINELLRTSKEVFDIIESAADGTFNSKDLVKSTKSVILALGQLLGIPTRNVYNLIYGLTKRFYPAGAYRIDSTMRELPYRSDLKKAIKYEDDAMIKTIADLMSNEAVGGIATEGTREALSDLAQKGYDNILPRDINKTISYEGEEHELTRGQLTKARKSYAKATDEISRLIRTANYKNADDSTRASMIRFINNYYYEQAVTEALDKPNGKTELVAVGIPISQLAGIVGTCKSIQADKDLAGNPISGSRKRKIIAFLQKQSLTAAQKYMILGYLGYKNKNGEDKVKGYVNTLNLSKSDISRLVTISGY